MKIDLRSINRKFMLADLMNNLKRFGPKGQDFILQIHAQKCYLTPGQDHYLLNLYSKHLKRIEQLRKTVKKSKKHRQFSQKPGSWIDSEKEECLDSIAVLAQETTPPVIENHRPEESGNPT